MTLPIDGWTCSLALITEIREEYTAAHLLTMRRRTVSCRMVFSQLFGNTLGRPNPTKKVRPSIDDFTLALLCHFGPDYLATVALS